MFCERHINEWRAAGWLPRFQESDQILRGKEFKRGKWKFPHNLVQRFYIFHRESPKTILILSHTFDHRPNLYILFQLCDNHMISLYSGDIGSLWTLSFLPPNTYCSIWIWVNISGRKTQTPFKTKDLNIWFRNSEEPEPILKSASASDVRAKAGLGCRGEEWRRSWEKTKASASFL